jgi:hypothetical protein
MAIESSWIYPLNMVIFHSFLVNVDQAGQFTVNSMPAVLFARHRA